MTAPTPSDPQTDFNNDLGALNAAAADYAAAEAEQAAADKIYQEQVLTKLDSLKDAFQILAFLIYFVFQNTEPPTNPTQADACIFGLMGNQVGIKGKALAVNSLLTKVHNDLQKLVDSNDTTTTDVKNVASDLDKLLKDFQSNPNLKQAIDPTTFQQMQDTDLTIRHQFFINGDTSGFNPPENSDPTKNGYTYHFTDGTESFYLHSFGEMQNNMKTPGDTNEANEAFKTLWLSVCEIEFISIS